MVTENDVSTRACKSDGALHRDRSSEDDPDTSRCAFLFSSGVNRIRDEPVVSNRSTDWDFGSRLTSRLRSWVLSSFSRSVKGNLMLYDAAPATEAGQCRVTRNTSGKNDIATSRSSMSIVFTIRDIMCCTWGNLLLVFVPIGIVTYLSKAHPSIVFTSNAIAILPLSGLLTYATESIARDMGDTVGALMNISFGNLIEVVILTALFNNKIRIVQASLLGSILVNLLLILGTAILAGSFQYQEQSYNVANSQALACLLCFSVFSLLIPTAFYHSFRNMETADQSVLTLSRVSALALLVIYCLYLLFQLKSHAHLTSHGRHHDSHMHSCIGSLMSRDQDHNRTRSTSASSCSRIIRIAIEDPAYENPTPPLDSDLTAKNLVELNTIDGGQRFTSNAESHVQSDTACSRNHVDRPNQGREGTIRQQRKAHPLNSRAYASKTPPPLRLPSSRGVLAPDDSTRQGLLRSTSSLPQLHCSCGSLDYIPNDGLPDSAPIISRTASLILLIFSSTLVAFCAEFLVNTIDDVAAHSPLSEPFIGLIILPVAGNVAEHITAVTVARKNKMDLAISVSVGSSIQIALFVTPLVVVMGWILDRDMTLYFSLFETVTLVATAFLVNFVILDGKTNYMEGSLLCACYVIIGMGAYLFPGPDE